MARSSKRCLPWSGYTWSFRLSCCTQSEVWCRTVESLDTIAVPGEWSTALVLHCSRTIAAYPYVLQAWFALPARTSCRLMMALMSSILEAGVHTLGTRRPSSTGRPARLF
jgi:hypothetical protein